MESRFFPTSFDPSDPVLGAFERPLSWRWRSCGQALQHFSSHGVVSRLPLFWQTEVPLFEACKEAGATLFLNDRSNMPVGREALRAGLDTVLTTLEDAAVFAKHLADHKAREPHWLIIHEAAWRELPVLLNDARVRVAQEIHYYPGVPILVQCERLIDAKKPQFHKVSDAQVASLTERLSLRTVGTCPCGEDIFK